MQWSPRNNTLPVGAGSGQGQGRSRRLDSPTQSCYTRPSRDRDAAHELRGGLECEDQGRLPIDVAATEKIKQAIQDEPRRRMDEAPGKRATDQDRHPNAATSASAQEEDKEEGEQSNKRSRLDEGAVAEEETKVAEEDEDSEPSSDEEDDK